GSCGRTSRRLTIRSPPRGNVPARAASLLLVWSRGVDMAGLLADAPVYGDAVRPPPRWWSPQHHEVQGSEGGSLWRHGGRHAAGHRSRLCTRAVRGPTERSTT